jgi:hypothetical protein
MTTAIEIRTLIENASIEEKVNMVDKLYKKWILPTNDNNVINKLESAIINLGLDPNNIQLGQFETANLIAINESIYLNLFIEMEDSMNDADKKNVLRKCQAVTKIIVSAENTIRYAIKLQNSMIENDIGTDENKDMFDFTPIDTSTNSKYQNLLLYLLENLTRKGFQRYNDSCYRKIYTPNGNDTLCWKKAMSIEEFIYDSVRKETNYEMWQNLTSGTGIVSPCVTYLQNHRGIEFVDIIKDRNVFSFNDGIYITKKIVNGLYTDDWIPYGTKKIASSVTSSNYFNFNFCSETRPDPNDKDYVFNDWWSIVLLKCPHFHSIMEYQEWETDVKKWMCIMIGRCLYTTGSLDNWQVIAFLLGQAGTGKSTIINFILKCIYEPSDVGTISNNIESKFGLQAIYKKLIFIAPEIKGNFKLEQSEFQSLISGEGMSVAEKNKEAVSIENWGVPGMLAGNEVPNYTDNSGSISRRLLNFLFNKKVKKGDTQLGLKIGKEIGFIIQACNRAYLETVNEHGSDDIWSIVPEYFIKTRDEMAETTNALVGFLLSGYVSLDATKSCKETAFIETFNFYCKEMNIPKQRWNGQYCMGPFGNFNITTKKHDRKDGVTCTTYHGVHIEMIVPTTKDSDDPYEPEIEPLPVSKSVTGPLRT